MDCIGYRALAPGLYISQQQHTIFGLSYRTLFGDNSGLNYYKIHVFYNCLARPSEKQYSSINDNPETSTYTWDVDTHPSIVKGFKPSSFITFDSRKLDPIYMHEVERILYGSASLPTLNTLIDMFSDNYWLVYDSFGNAILDSNDDYIIGFGRLN